MINEPLEYSKCRAAVKWGEIHGKLQFPDKEYEYEVGVDPTTARLKSTKPHLIPFKSCPEQSN